MKLNLNQTAAFGVAGNFTGHLEQAGEASDFISIKTKEKNAPKAVFPTYIPGAKEPVPEFLGTFPFDSAKIIFPEGEEKLQIEPECALLCKAEWSGNNITGISPYMFGASNDCSIRKEGAKKISMKKNWGASSKGLSDNLIGLDKFTAGGILDGYRIASFLVRDSSVYEYGEDSPVNGYSYMYEKLLDWCIEKFNGQTDEGPAEKIGEYLISAGKPKQILISIGATRYTEFGETNFLKNNDESVVVLYPGNKYSKEEITEKVMKDDFTDSKISVLRQRIVLNSSSE